MGKSTTSRDSTVPANRPSGVSLPWALAIILVFLVLATLYSISTPIYESPDELQHAAFVTRLTEGRGLPVVDPENLGPWEQEGTQPPLYYWLAARLASGPSPAGNAELAVLNPYAGIGDPLRPDNKNRVLHDLDEERWPYSADALFVHLVRGISTLMAAGTLVAVYRLGQFVFPDRRGIALGMMGLVAFIPQFLFLSASINNDNLVILIAAWVLVLLSKWLSPMASSKMAALPGWRSLAGLGILLGLGPLAKFSGLLLWPLAGAMMLWLAWRERRFRWLIPAGLTVFGLALAISGWWFVRNQQLYGDLSAIAPHLAIMETRDKLPRLQGLLAEFRGLRYSFWALFGWFNILIPDPFYWIVDGLSAVGFLGFVLFLIRSLRSQAPGFRHAIWMLLVWFGLVFAAFVRWTLLTPASQGRLLYPALPAIALGLVVGWAELVPKRFRGAVGVAALAAWALWAALCPLLFIKPAYALPQRVQSVSELPVEFAELQVRYDDCCTLVGYVAPDEPVHPGDRVPLTLIWQAAETGGEDYSLFVHATTTDGQIVGQLDTYHGRGMYPTGQWQAGEFIIDTVYVPISPRAKGPALIRFNVGLHIIIEGDGQSGLERLPAYSMDGQELDTVFAGEVALRPFYWPELPSVPPVDAIFEDQIRLVDVELIQSTAHPGATITTTLLWQALDSITEDYIGFVHLVGPNGRDVAQDDHPPANGYFPTRLWFADAIVVDTYRLELPGDLEDGTYELWGGFYRLESGQRLLAISPATGERWKDDLVLLGTVAVVSEGQNR
jgi:4-amino-4-deoxy-L-arabinose transferase-like glycosyltransferase